MVRGIWDSISLEFRLPNRRSDAPNAGVGLAGLVGEGRRWLELTHAMAMR